MSKLMDGKAEFFKYSNPLCLDKVAGVAAVR
jgi:hypothetical protein